MTLTKGNFGVPCRTEPAREMTTAETDGLPPTAAFPRVADGQTSGGLWSLRASAGWETTWFLDEGVSGARERRPGLDALFWPRGVGRSTLVLCCEARRLARSVHHLVAFGKDWRRSG